MPTDITPYASYVYEITSNGVKKVTRLAKNTTCAMFINNNIYYTSYPQSENTEGSEMYTVKVYKCKKDGTNKKCIFTRKLDDKNSYVLVQTITENTIHFVETTEVNLQNLCMIVQHIQLKNLLKNKKNGKGHMQYACGSFFFEQKWYNKSSQIKVHNRERRNKVCGFCMHLALPCLQDLRLYLQNAGFEKQIQT